MAGLTMRKFCRFSQIFDEIGESLLAALLIGHAQDGRGMKRHHSLHAVEKIQPLPALAAERQSFAGKRMSRGRPQGDDENRLNNRHLALEPPAALLDLIAIRPLMQPPFAPRLVFEMLDRIGDIDRTPIEACFHKCAIEHGAGRPDKGMALNVFLIARLFADENERRRGIAFAEDGLRRVLVKWTALAACRLVRECG